MSVAEITEKLKELTSAERKEIARALLALDAQEEKVPQATNFADAKTYVFENYGELLRRLAQ